MSEKRETGDERADEKAEKVEKEVDEKVEKKVDKKVDEEKRDGQDWGETDEEEKRDDRETPADTEDPDAPAAVNFFGYIQDGIYYLIAAVLVGLAFAAMVRIGFDFFTLEESFAKRVTRAVNEVLFIIIVLELLRTILAHFEDDTFQLKPFLIIGIISSVRHILTVGAELSLAEEDTSHLFHRADVELGVNAMVVLVLVLGLVLVRKTE